MPDHRAFAPKHPAFNPAKSIEPREARPWLPAWSVTIGPLVESGKGILSPAMWKQRDLIEKFSVFVQPCSVTVHVDLKTGAISFNAQLQFKPEPSLSPFRLIWFRRMAQQLFTLDHNSAAPDCEYYGVGWQRTLMMRNEKVVYRIYGSGQIEKEA